jgi:hypothetical protein
MDSEAKAVFLQGDVRQQINAATFNHTKIEDHKREK